MIPHITEACPGGRTAIMTTRIAVGETTEGADVEVYVADAYSTGEPAEVVIAINTGDPTTKDHWGVVGMSDPAVVRRLADSLPAAALVLERLQNGGLP